MVYFVGDMDSSTVLANKYQMIDKSIVDRIYLAANIVEVVGDFASLNKKGVNYQACCPFHDEKTPSFVVSPTKGIYKCFGCGKAGNSITFVMEHESMTYVEALRYLAKKYSIEIVETGNSEKQIEQKNDRDSLLALNEYTSKFFVDKLANSSEGRNIGRSYFYERGYTDETIEKFQLGYAPQQSDLFARKALEDGYKEKYLVESGLSIKRDSGGYYDRFSGRVMFPIHSLSGNVLGFGGRILTSEKNKAKYLNSPESAVYHKSQTLYGIYFAKSEIVKEKKCILVEGYTDVISMMQAGIQNVVASSGTSLTVEQVKLIRRFTTNVTVMYDGDKAGIKASLRGVDIILTEGLNVRIVSLPDGHDPDSFAKSQSAIQTKEYIEKNEEDFISFKAKFLMSEVKNDPMGRAEVITEIVNTIAVIPNEILRAQYSNECAKILEQDNQLIIRNVERRRAMLLDGDQGVRHFDYKIQKENYSRNASTAQKVDISVNERSSVEAMEKELIGYLIKYGMQNIITLDDDNNDLEVNIAEEIIGEIRLDDLSFETSICQLIFDEYVKIKEENVYTDDKVILNDLINHRNPEVCKFVVELITQEEMYPQSRLWEKLDRSLTESDMLNVFVPKAIAIYKLKILSKIKNEYLGALKIDAYNFEILRHINVINQARQRTCEKYSRII